MYSTHKARLNSVSYFAQSILHKERIIEGVKYNFKT